MPTSSYTNCPCCQSSSSSVCCVRIRFRITCVDGVYTLTSYLPDGSTTVSEFASNNCEDLQFSNVAIGDLCTASLVNVSSNEDAVCSSSSSSSSSSESRQWYCMLPPESSSSGSFVEQCECNMPTTLYIKITPTSGDCLDCIPEELVIPVEWNPISERWENPSFVICDLPPGFQYFQCIPELGPPSYFLVSFYGGGVAAGEYTICDTPFYWEVTGVEMSNEFGGICNGTADIVVTSEP